MKFLLLALIPLLFSLTAEAAVPAGVRCEAVKRSSIRDLSDFCRSELDKRRLVDYGSQLEALHACGEAALAKNLAKALQAKVKEADAATCDKIAEGLEAELQAQVLKSLK